MGAWPCGTIVMLGKLYGSESMSQVYGQIFIASYTQYMYIDSLGGLLNYYTCMMHDRCNQKKSQTIFML